MAQAMLDQKEYILPNGDSERKRKRVVMTETTVDMEIKRHLNFSLLSTTYPLNTSCSKKIVVGLLYNHDTDNFEPTITLLNYQYSTGLNFDSETWTRLQEAFTEISRYFDSGSRYQPSKMNIGKLDIVFTSSYGIKSVIFDLPRIFEDTKQGGCKKRMYTPAVVLQKRTFQGLRRVSVCVEERFNRLRRIASEVNQCKSFVFNEIKDLFSASDMDQPNDVILSIISDKSRKIKDSVKSKFDKKNKVFLEHHFDMAFFEMIYVCSGIFYNLLKQHYINEEENFKFTFASTQPV